MLNSNGLQLKERALLPSIKYCGGLYMEKRKIITITLCAVFIVFSGIMYLKPGTSGTSTSFINGPVNATGTAGSTVQDGQEWNGSNGKEAGYENSVLTAADEIAVYICGAVKHPGVYSLSNGQRVCDAVSAAGGFKKSAARYAINLAKTLSDGEQVTVPTKKQASSYNSGKKQDSKDKNINSPEEKTGLVNINTAPKEELMALPGIGESKADAVIEYRLSNSFKSIEDIKNVTGIKDGVFNQIKDQITV